MRILRINDQDVDIDAKTAIGITFQAYDFKEPGQRKVSLSNTFTIPSTIKNQALFGYAGNPQSLSTIIYGSFLCDYWVDNKHLIIGAKIRIDEIANGRIKLYVYKKEDFWDEIKKYNYIDFPEEFLLFLQTEKGYPAATQEGLTYWEGTYANFINQYIDTDEGLIIPYYFGNLFKYEPGGEGTGFLEDEDNIYLSGYSSKGGHICAYVKTIFEFIEYKFGVDFLTSSEDIDLIWQDAYATKIYIPIRSYLVGNIIDEGKWGFINLPELINPYLPYEDMRERPDKTLYDFVKAFMQLFNIILDEEIIDEVHTIKMYRFDDIETKAEVVPFSGNLDLSKIKFKPKIDGYEQINRIKYEVMYPGGNEFEGAKNIVCNNFNLEPLKELFSIDAYYPNIVINTNEEAVINLSTEESFETFVFLISNGMTINNINVKIGTVHSYGYHLEIAAIYGISGEYNFIEDILAYPKYYEIEKWININDLLDFKFFRQYHIKELNGSFFINKIKGFNPEKSNVATKFELIRISDKVPKPIDIYLDSFYIDGVGNAFVDGNGNNFV